jgi:hypothetical protein
MKETTQPAPRPRALTDGVGGLTTASRAKRKKTGSDNI